MTTLATKAVAGLAAAAIVTAGAAEVKHVAGKDRSKAGATTIAAVAPQAPPAAAAASTPEPVAVRSAPQPAAEAGRKQGDDKQDAKAQEPGAQERKVDVTPVPAGEDAARRPTPSSTTAT